MAVSLGLGITIPAGVSYYRITPRRFWTRNARNHREVVNGEGAVCSRRGARYHYPGVRTVYLAEKPLVCIAETRFYFHRDTLTNLDNLHLMPTPVMPPFQQTFVLWDIKFRKDVPNAFDLSVANAPAAEVYPCLLLNPSQDYMYLKDRRADIQTSGYFGLRASSTRVTQAGNMMVLFDDQSANLASITPYEIEFRLLTPSGTPFLNHSTDQLDFHCGEVRIIATGAGLLPPALRPFAAWTVVPFHH